MTYSKETFKKADSILKTRRNKNIIEAENRRKVFYKETPRAYEIEKELCNTATAVGRAIVNKIDTKTQLEELKVKNLALQEELKTLLLKSSLDENYLEPNFDCKKCSDKGLIDGKICSCYKTLLRDITFEDLNKLSPLSLSSFDTFSVDYYDTQEVNGISPREKMTKILEYCKEYTKSFNQSSPSLLIQGGTGLGKTHLSLSIANELINIGYGVVYFSAPNLIQKLEQEHFSKNLEEETLAQLINCDLLILDDLGTEFNTQFSNSTIYNLFNTRLSSNKPIIISTNLNLNELEKQYSQRFVSRIIGNCVKMNFVGKDIRFIKRSI